LNWRARYAEANFYLGADSDNLKICIDKLQQIGKIFYFAIIANPVTQQALAYSNERFAGICNMS